jgi:23S rRNA-/tRNA-specific pseudouridylate synthase
MTTTWAKPPGLPVFPPHVDPAGPCVLAEVLVAMPWRASVAWPSGFEGGIAHRLDTATSGALWLADSVDELAAMRAAFAGGVLRKTYRLLATTPPAWSERVCARPIAHDAKHKRRMVVQRHAHTAHRGRWYPAHTAFRSLEGALVEAVITTGVMHQIRVHAAFEGIPLRGDALYGGGEPEPGAGAATPFRLHHVGLVGPGWATQPVALPDWANVAGAPR